MKNIGVLLRRLFYCLIGFQIIYLIAANVILSSSFGRELINSKPHLFKIDYENAKSFFPGHISAEKLAIAVQTPRVQWQAFANSGSAVLSPIALLVRTLRINNAALEQGGMLLRPRPSDGKNFDNIAEFLPEIEAFAWQAMDENEAGERAKSADKKPWKIEINDLNFSDVSTIRLANYDLSGELNGGLTLGYLTRHDLTIPELELNGAIKTIAFNNKPVATSGNVNGTLNIAAYNPKENRGIKVLPFVSGDLQLALSLDSLSFFNFYLAKLPWLNLAGQGDLSGRLRIQKGQFFDGTDIGITGAQIVAGLDDFSVEGVGGIKVRVTQAAESQLAEIILRLDETQLMRDGFDKPQIQASGFSVSVAGPSIGLGEPVPTLSAQIVLDKGTAKSIALFNEFLPESSGLEFTSGSAKVSGEVVVAGSSVSGEVKLAGRGVGANVRQNALTGDLDVLLKLSSSSVTQSVVNLSGSHVAVGNVQIENQRGSSERWSGKLNLQQVLVTPSLREASDVDAKKTSKRKSRVRFENGKLKLNATASSIEFLNTLLPQSLESFAVSGTGKVRMDMHMKDDKLMPGSAFTIKSPDLGLSFLNFRASGEGEVDAKLDGKVGDLSMNMRLGLQQVSVSDNSVAAPYVFVPEMTASVSVDSVERPRDVTTGNISLLIKDASVPDMTTYNRYLPERAGVSFLRGSGTVNADVRLEQSSASARANTNADTSTGAVASANVKLVAPGLKVRVREETIAGDLQIDAVLKSTDIDDDLFDATNSRVSFTNLSIGGAEQQIANTSPWFASSVVESGSLKWKAPLEFTGIIGVHLKDSRPFFDLTAAQKASQKVGGGWIKKLFTVENIRGRGEVELNKERVVINNMDLSGGPLRFQSKLKLQDKSLDGVVLAQYERLKSAVLFKHSERDWKFIRATKTYENYPPF